MTNQALGRRDKKFLCKRSNVKSRHSKIHLQGHSLQSSAKGLSEMDSCLEEGNPDQKWFEIETYIYSKDCRKRAKCNYEIWKNQKTYGTRESRS